jgi:hypothetical protein
MGTALIARRLQDQGRPHKYARRRTRVAKVPTEFQLLRGITRANPATRCEYAIIYGPAPAAEHPVRPLAPAPAAEHTAYIVACQLADEARNANGGPALNDRPTDAELKTTGQLVMELL